MVCASTGSHWRRLTVRSAQLAAQVLGRSAELARSQLAAIRIAEFLHESPPDDTSLTAAMDAAEPPAEEHPQASHGGDDEEDVGPCEVCELTHEDSSSSLMSTLWLWKPLLGPLS